MGINGVALEFAPAELRGNRDIVLAAIEQNGEALRHASAELRSDREVVLKAIVDSEWALAYAADELRTSWSFVLGAVRLNGAALQHANNELEEDPEIVIAAMGQIGQAIQDVCGTDVPSQSRADRSPLLDVSRCESPKASEPEAKLFLDISDDFTFSGGDEGVS